MYERAPLEPEGMWEGAFKNASVGTFGDMWESAFIFISEGTMGGI